MTAKHCWQGINGQVYRPQTVFPETRGERYKWRWPTPPPNSSASEGTNFRAWPESPQQHTPGSMGDPELTNCSRLDCVSKKKIHVEVLTSVPQNVTFGNWSRYRCDYLVKIKSLGWPLIETTVGLTKRGHLDTDAHEAKKLPELSREAWNRPSSRAFRPLASRTVRRQTSGAPSHPGCGTTLLRQPQETKPRRYQHLARPETAGKFFPTTPHPVHQEVKNKPQEPEAEFG